MSINPQIGDRFVLCLIYFVNLSKKDPVFCPKVLGILTFSILGLFFSLYSYSLFLELIFQTTVLNVNMMLFC